MNSKFSNDTADRDEFARQFMQAMRRAGETGNITYDPQQFSLILRGDYQGPLYLTHLYREHLGAPPQMRRAAIDSLAQNIIIGKGASLPPTIDEAKKCLLPRIDARSRMQHDPGREGNRVYRALGDELVVELAWDHPRMILIVRQNDLDSWGISFEEGLGIARENLQAKSAGKWDEIARGCWLSPWQDNYDASRLVLTDMIRRLPVKGDHVAIAPNRDHLFVSGTGEWEGMREMAKGMVFCMSAPRFICDEALRLS